MITVSSYLSMSILCIIACLTFIKLLHLILVMNMQPRLLPRHHCEKAGTQWALVLMVALLSSIKTFDWSKPHLDDDVAALVVGTVLMTLPVTLRPRSCFAVRPLTGEKSGGRGSIRGARGSPPAKWGPCSPHKRCAPPRAETVDASKGISFALPRVSHARPTSILLPEIVQQFCAG